MILGRIWTKLIKIIEPSVKERRAREKVIFCDEIKIGDKNL